MNISQIRDYVEQDKPIAGTVAKDWLRYLLQERNSMIECLQDVNLNLADANVLHNLRKYVEQTLNKSEESK